MSDEKLVVAIDPGLLTGACIVGFDPDGGCKLYQSRELTFREILPWCQLELPTADYVVAERFTVNQRTIKNTQAPWSLEALGVVRAVLLQQDRNLSLQNPGDAMKFVSNEMLHRLELWHRGGEGHANDALRHAVLFAVKHLHWRDPRLVV